MPLSALQMVRLALRHPASSWQELLLQLSRDISSVNKTRLAAWPRMRFSEHS